MKFAKKWADVKVGLNDFNQGGIGWIRKMEVTMEKFGDLICDMKYNVSEELVPIILNMKFTVDDLLNRTGMIGGLLSSHNRAQRHKFLFIIPLLYDLKARLKKEYPNEFIQISDITREDKFLLCEIINFKGFITYINKAREHLKEQIDGIDNIARIMFEADLISGEFKDFCYNIKDSEQYNRYIDRIVTLLDTSDGITKINTYLVKEINMMHSKYI